MDGVSLSVLSRNEGMEWPAQQIQIRKHTAQINTSIWLLFTFTFTPPIFTFHSRNCVTFSSFFLSVVQPPPSIIAYHTFESISHRLSILWSVIQSVSQSVSQSILSRINQTSKKPKGKDDKDDNLKHLKGNNLLRIGRERKGAVGLSNGNGYVQCVCVRACNCMGRILTNGSSTQRKQKKKKKENEWRGGSHGELTTRETKKTSKLSLTRSDAITKGISWWYSPWHTKHCECEMWIRQKRSTRCMPWTCSLIVQLARCSRS